MERSRSGLWGLIGAVLVAGLATSSASAQEPAPPPPKPDATVDTKPNLTGVLQFDYRRADSDDRKGPEHEFSVRRARLGLSGKATHRIAYDVVLQLDGGSPLSASLLDGSVDVTFKDWAKLRVGQFKYDFDIEGREVASALIFMDRSFTANTVAGSLDGSSTSSRPAAAFRDRGASLLGKVKSGHWKWTYAMGLFQGTGRASDNNSGFALVARVSVEPAKGLRIGTGIIGNDAKERGVEGRNHYTAWTVGGEYEWRKLLLRAEYYGAERDRGTATQDLSGFYVMGGYSVWKNVELLVRYQRLQDGQFAAGNDVLDSIDLAAKWYIARRGKRAGTALAVNYLIRSADDGINKGVTLLNDGRGNALTSGAEVGSVLMARVQVHF